MAIGTFLVSRLSRASQCKSIARNLQQTAALSFQSTYMSSPGSPLIQKWENAARAFSSKPAGSDVIGIDLGTTNSCVAVMEGKVCCLCLNAKIINILIFTHLSH